MAAHVEDVSTSAVPYETAVRVRRPRLGRLPLHLVVLGVTAIWLIPLIGLLVSSFRPTPAVLSTGWWHSFTLPGGFGS